MLGADELVEIPRQEDVIDAFLQQLSRPGSQVIDAAGESRIIRMHPAVRVGPGARQLPDLR